jgi:hypothetical protein
MDMIFRFFIVISLFFSFTANAQDLESKDTSVAAASNTGLSLELAELKAFFSNGNKGEQMLAINSRIRFSGITDVTLFDIAEKNMLEVSPKTVSREEIEYVSWMAQMLAFSGQEKYRASLNKVLISTKTAVIRHHIRSSLEVLPKYQRWNLIISQNLENVPLSALSRVRLINMLNGDDPELVRGAASIVNHFYLGDEQITDLVERRLLVLYPQSISSDEYDEASAWLCKILGNTKKQKYVSTLKQARKSPKHSSVHSWALKALQNISD